MAIKVTGIFENPHSKLMYKNPLLELVPHLAPYGKVLVDVNIKVDDVQVGSIGMDIDRNELEYNTSIEDGHDRLFNALQVYVLLWLETNLPDCEYKIVSPNLPTANASEAP
jgi:hypothetical protein